MKFAGLSVRTKKFPMGQHLKDGWRETVIPMRRKLKRIRRVGLIGSLVELGLHLLGWLIRMIVWAIYAALIAIAIIDNLWEEEQLTWWRIV